ncbi:MAG: type I methionyl aminopeptidase [Verrucomicrobia bacterium]|nr:type I methionyl aminopeptidase [Verrucomicrobiota bacterium]
MAKRSKIPIKTKQEIVMMREAGKVASDVLQRTAGFIAAGKTTREVDEYALSLIEEHKVKSAFYKYRDFPGYTCISMNEEVVHGIGGDRVIKDGDLVKLDVGVKRQGWIGDNALTVPVGKINGEQKRLLAVTEESLFVAISHARAGATLYDLCGSVEDYVTKFGFTVVRDLVGHGVGRQLHEEPQVPNYHPGGKSPILKAGMILAIEPMINAGVGTVDWLDDGWTVSTSDRRPSSHFEHTVLVTNGDPEILTWRPRTALPEQLDIPPLG